MNNDQVSVYMNDVNVGGMSLDKYHSIIEEVKKEKGYKAREILGFLYYLVVVAGRAVFYFFIAFCVLAVLLVLVLQFHSSIILPAFVVFLTASPDVFERVINELVATSAVAAIVLTLFSTIDRSYTSPSKIAINKKLRMYLFVPAEGRVKVVVKKEPYGINHTADKAG
ncbi:hypothetical protein [Pantoea ananatis]|uniref:hypothetical protein n=1 Tax=Pantoea ananas TaxID=553 RepID=UPI001B30B3EF|nr:hypothetical protein [Pantoea ananatis]